MKKIQDNIKDLLINTLKDITYSDINLETQSDSAYGDFSSPCILENFKRFKAIEGFSFELSNPRALAITIAAKINESLPAWLERVEAAGPGFLNFYLNKNYFSNLVLERAVRADFVNYSNDFKDKIIVEHTSVNPNKAMHIGHLRNAFIGDMIVRILRKFNYKVEVENYIDDTGLQVADTTLALSALHKIQPANQSFDDFAWDIYAEINELYKTDKDLLAKREEVSREIEKGDGEVFEKSQEVVDKIVSQHLKLLCQMGIKYDLLVYESDIIKSGFWASAFEKLKESNNFFLAKEGKQAGCWVLKYKNDKFGDKVFVRSNGTVVYTGKDLAYHMWKFGVLGKDFGYLLKEYDGFSVHKTSHKNSDMAQAGSYGGARMVINVIDERQEYPQEMVRYGLEALGYENLYKNFNHLAYGVVNLSLNTAKELGLNISEDKDSYAMSGRKGIGVKAKDLLNLLINKVKEKNDAANTDKIAVGALKHYMLKYNPISEIVFDYETALNLKGNTGPYLQYSYARAFNILSKAENFEPQFTIAESIDSHTYELIKLMAEWSDIIEKASKDFMLSYISDYAFKLSSSFHRFYETNNVLKAEKEVKNYRLTIIKSYLNTIKDVLSIMGIEVVEKM